MSSVRAVDGIVTMQKFICIYSLVQLVCRANRHCSRFRYISIAYIIRAESGVSINMRLCSLHIFYYGNTFGCFMELTIYIQHIVVLNQTRKS